MDLFMDFSKYYKIKLFRIMNNQKCSNYPIVSDNDKQFGQYAHTETNAFCPIIVNRNMRVKERLSRNMIPIYSYLWL